MGTNYYWVKKQKWMDEYPQIKNLNFEEDDEHPLIHLGKRSGAGNYCMRCGITMCDGGDREIHMSGHYWNEVCPACGEKDQFKYICTFTWTMRRHEKEIKELVYQGCTDKVIADEYGELFTPEEFLQELSSCEVMFQHYARFG